MSELSMTSFAALNANKSSVFQIRNQLAYFARHTGNCDESQRLFPVPFLVALSIVDRPLAVHRDGCKSHFFLRPSSKSGIWINYALLTPHPSSVVKDPETERETLRGWLAAFDRAAKEMNRPQVIFYTYLKDEPNTLEDYRYVQKWGRAVRAAHSVVKVLVVEQPWTEPGQGGADSAWGGLYGAVDIWCPLFSLHRQESAARRQALDETIWTSISGDTDAHFARRAAWLRRTDGRARSLNVASKAASSSFSNSLCATWNPGSTKSSLPSGFNASRSSAKRAAEFGTS